MYFPNLVIFTNSATLEEVQLTFNQNCVGNKLLEGGDISIFSLVGSLKTLMVVSFNTVHAFSISVDKIFILIMEIIICTATKYLTCSKKQQYWLPLNSVLLT